MALAGHVACMIRDMHNTFRSETTKVRDNLADLSADERITFWHEDPLLGSRFVTRNNGVTWKRCSLRGPCDIYVTQQKNCRKRCFLCGSYQGYITRSTCDWERRESWDGSEMSWRLVWDGRQRGSWSEVSCLVSELVKGLLRFTPCELLALETGSWGRVTVQTQRTVLRRHRSCCSELQIVWISVSAIVICSYVL
jgi:hypothetical protein